MRKRTNRMNKKGDVPVMILVIGVVAICILTIFSFVSFKKSSDKDFKEGLYLFEQAHSDLEMFKFYQNLYGDNVAASKIDAKMVNENGKDKLVIEKREGGVSLKYEYEFPEK